MYKKQNKRETTNDCCLFSQVFKFRRISLLSVWNIYTTLIIRSQYFAMRSPERGPAIYSAAQTPSLVSHCHSPGSVEEIKRTPNSTMSKNSSKTKNYQPKPNLKQETLRSFHLFLNILYISYMQTTFRKIFFLGRVLIRVLFKDKVWVFAYYQRNSSCRKLCTIHTAKYDQIWLD